MSERASKGMFLKPDKLQNHSNEGKGVDEYELYFIPRIVRLDS